MTDLADLLRSRTVLLLDFDGRICSMFAGYPAPIIAQELREIAATNGIRVPPTDPLAFLRGIADIATPDQTRAVDDALRNREIIAVATATETPGAFKAIQTARATGRKVAVVSNKLPRCHRRLLGRP